MTHIGYDDLRADTVIGVAKLMAAAAITAPKSGGQLFLQGKPNFMETVIVADPDTKGRIADCCGHVARSGAKSSGSATPK
jgi:hypothetical protein